MVQEAILQIKNIYYPLLATFGVPANVLTIVILCRQNCGLSKCISVYMVAMAVVDLLVVIFNVTVYLIFNYHFPYSFLSYTAVCKAILYIAFVNVEMSVWFTASFAFDRFVAICCQKFKAKYCTKRIATTVILTLAVLTFLKCIPLLFTYEPEQLINNAYWGCRTKADVFTLPGWTFYSWLQSLSLPLLPFALMTLFNSLTIRRILMANKARKGLQGKNNGSQSDPELKNRRKSIILLFSISGSLIFLWLTSLGSFSATRLTSTVYYQGDYSNPEYIATESGYLLMYLSSCTNAYIYGVTQTKFREELKNILKYPWTFFLKLVKNEKKIQSNKG